MMTLISLAIVLTKFFALAPSIFVHSVFSGEEENTTTAPDLLMFGGSILFDLMVVLSLALGTKAWPFGLASGIALAFTALTVTDAPQLLAAIIIAAIATFAFTAVTKYFAPKLELAQNQPELKTE